MPPRNDDKKTSIKDTLSSLCAKLADAVAENYIGKSDDEPPSVYAKTFAAGSGVLSFIVTASSLGMYNVQALEFVKGWLPIALSIVTLFTAFVLAAVIGYGRGLLRFYLVGFFVYSLIYYSVWVNAPTSADG